MPAGAQFGTVRFRDVSLAADGLTDADALPDVQPVAGWVTFTPSVTVLLDPTSSPPVTVFPREVTYEIGADGVLRDYEGRDEITLLATSSAGLNPRDWTWRAAFRFTDPAIKRDAFSFALAAGATVDLTTAAPVAASDGVAVIQGPPGPQGPQGPPGSGAPPASGTDYGSIKLAGDLGGTAAAPTVPGLADKIDVDEMGVPGGVATLDAGGKLTAAQAPAIIAAGISDSTTVGQAVLTAADQASARGAIGAGTSNLASSSVEALVKWTGSAWPSRPSGFARVRWSSEGSTTATQPPGMVAGDVWEHPA